MELVCVSCYVIHTTYEIFVMLGSIAFTRYYFCKQETLKSNFQETEESCSMARVKLPACYLEAVSTCESVRKWTLYYQRFQLQQREQEVTKRAVPSITDREEHITVNLSLQLTLLDLCNSTPALLSVRALSQSAAIHSYVTKSLRI